MNKQRPNIKIICSIHKTGKNNNLYVNGILNINKNTNSTINSKIKFIKFEPTVETGKISRGKYDFVMRDEFCIIFNIEFDIEIEKKFHGKIPHNKNIG